MNASHARRAPLVVALVLLLVALGGPPTSHAATTASPTLRLTSDGLLEHLEALQAIADANGGDRAADTPGYEASVDYVVGRLEAAGYAVSVEPFALPDAPVRLGPPTFERTAPSGRTYVDGTDYDVPTPGAPSTVSGDIHLVADGCDLDSYDTAPPGAVLLVTIDDACPAIVLVYFAELVGAGGLVLGPAAGAGAPLQHVDLGSLAFDSDLPTVSVSGDAAAELGTLAGGATVTVSIDPGWGSDPVTTTNVLAEWPGATDEVVMVGAHLDSVIGVPGINDNGSGTAGVLAIAEALAAGELHTERTIRFAWWGAEELGLVGSDAYVGSLPPAELDRITAYLNVDMIGSPNWIRGVGDPAVANVPDTVSPGSAEITARFEAYFAGLGLPTESIWSDGRSDDGSFARAGVPVGSLFTGFDTPKTAEQFALFGGTEGAPLDPCYHRACDTLANVDLDITLENTEALAAVTLELAGTIEDPVIPSPPPATPQAVAARPVGAVPAFTG